MSDYYAGQRTRGLFDPAAPTPHKLSRSKIEAFIIKQTEDTFEKVAQFVNGHVRQNNLT